MKDIDEKVVSGHSCCNDGIYKLSLLSVEQNHELSFILKNCFKKKFEENELEMLKTKSRI